MSARIMKHQLRAIVVKLLSPILRGILADKAFFKLFQNRGIHITRVHFYQPIPDTRNFDESNFPNLTEMRGIEKRLEAQRDFINNESFGSNLTEYSKIVEKYQKDKEIKVSFSGLDGAMLYHIIRTQKPKRIIEVGSGFSTVLSNEALQKNALEDGSHGALEAIEPYPHAYLTSGRLKQVTVDINKIQSIPLQRFEALESGDVLFIDSSHIVAFRSDVVYEINEILPRLKPGVFVHIHDIYLPFDYSREWIMERNVFWNEQYLVQAFLQFNDSFQIVWSAGLARAFLVEEVRKYFPEFDPREQQSGSLWIKRIR